MIKNDGSAASILEALYLEEELTSKVHGVTIEVNPAGLKWLSGKTIIINDRNYTVTSERGYGNTLITRVRSNWPGTRYVPYLARPIPAVRWSGQEFESRSQVIDEIRFDGSWLYVPKHLGYTCDEPDLDWYGYLQFQIGYNHYPGPIRDLGILKCSIPGTPRS